MGMNDLLRFAIEVVRANTLTERLAIASCEIAVLGAVVWLLARYRWIRSPRLVACCWLLVLSKAAASLVVGPVFLIADLRGSQPIQDRSVAIAYAPAVRETEPVEPQFAIDTPKQNPPSSAVTNEHRLPKDPMAISEFAVLLWLGGVLLFVSHSARDLLRVRRLAAIPAPQSVQNAARDAARCVGIRTTPGVWLTDEFDSPAVLGYFWPKIVVPRWLLADDEVSMDWILRHEMTHLRHRDHMANAIRRVAQSLFFFHPVVWFAARRWEESAEYACDAALAESPREARDYARRLYSLLLRMQHRRNAAVANGLYASRTQVGRRIEALLRRDGISEQASRKLQIAVLGFVIFTLAVGVGGSADSESRIIGGQEDHVHRFSTAIEESALTYELRVHAVGTIGFNADHSSITSMEDDAQLACTVNTLGKELQFVVTPNKDGAIDVLYRVNGDEVDLDDTGRNWLRRALKRVGRVRGTQP